MCLLKRKNRLDRFPNKENTTSMTYASVKVQIAPESVPSIPSWFSEVTVLAHMFTQYGVLNAIERRVRFTRARFGHYDTIDFVVILIGYAVSGEATLEAFYERLLPFASTYMALFGRNQLPCRSTLSRFLAALDRPSVEALRALFQEDLVARAPQTFPPGGLWDRLGRHWLVIDVDGTKQSARQRALPQTEALPAPHRRFDHVCAPGYLGRKRGEVTRTRTTVLQAHSHHWLGTFGGPGNGDYRGELTRALEAIICYAGWLCMPLSQMVIRLDGLYGNAAVIHDLLQFGVGIIVRCKDYGMLDLPAVQARLRLLPDQETTHPESGVSRALFDCPDLPLMPTGPRVRLIVATHPATSTKKPSIGILRGETVYELFLTTVPLHAFTPADVLDLYLHRGSFETVLADEDREQDPDRWCSRTACGQEFWQIVCQWIWNLRLELGQHLSASPMRLTEFAPAQASEPTQVVEPAQASEPTQVVESAQASEPTQVVEPAQASEPVLYGPPQWARRSFTKGFTGADFSLQPDGTLRCPAGHPLSAHERRPEHNGSLRILYSARLCHCRPCPLREQCQEAATTIKPRRVSAVFWPISSSPSVSAESPPTLVEPPPTQPEPAPYPILWGDWQRCRIRRQWIRLLRTQTVDLTFSSVQQEEKMAISHSDVQTRAERAHWRITWDQRLARNARLSTASPLQVTIHGLPAAFAQSFHFDVVTAA